MIKGIHAMFFVEKPEETRAFLRDKLGLPFTDVGEGWLIFDVAQGEIGCHPLMDGEAKSRHDISLYCDDVAATVEELKGKGVEFKHDIVDQGWGLETVLFAPGGLEITLYQPKYR